MIKSLQSHKFLQQQFMGVLDPGDQLPALAADGMDFHRHHVLFPQFYFTVLKNEPRLFQHDPRKHFPAKLIQIFVRLVFKQILKIPQTNFVEFLSVRKSPHVAFHFPDEFCFYAFAFVHFLTAPKIVPKEQFHHVSRSVRIFVTPSILSGRRYLRGGFEFCVNCVNPIYFVFSFSFFLCLGLLERFRRGDLWMGTGLPFIARAILKLVLVLKQAYSFLKIQETQVHFILKLYDKIKKSRYLRLKQQSRSIKQGGVIIQAMDKLLKIMNTCLQCSNQLCLKLKKYSNFIHWQEANQKLNPRNNPILKDCSRKDSNEMQKSENFVSIMFLSNIQNESKKFGQGLTLINSSCKRIETQFKFWYGQNLLPQECNQMINFLTRIIYFLFSTPQKIKKIKGLLLSCPFYFLRAFSCRAFTSQVSASLSKLISFVSSFSFIFLDYLKVVPKEQSFALLRRGIYQTQFSNQGYTKIDFSFENQDYSFF